jgi:hypothetical protein
MYRTLILFSPSIVVLLFDYFSFVFLPFPFDTLFFLCLHERFDYYLFIYFLKFVLSVFIIYQI